MNMRGKRVRMIFRKFVQTAFVTALAGLACTQLYAMSFSFSSSSKHERDEYTTNRPWGNLGPVKQAKQYQPPQPAANPYSSQYLGAAPGTGWHQTQYPAATGTIGGDPVVEVEVETTDAYERQNIIYTVHVVSDGNIAVLDDLLPRIEGATIEQIDILGTPAGALEQFFDPGR